MFQVQAKIRTFLGWGVRGREGGREGGSEGVLVEAAGATRDWI